MDINKLIEQTAELLSEFKDWDNAREFVKEGWRHKAKQILSHPDLALINRDEAKWGDGVFLYRVIPLAEAIKESDE